MLLSLFAPERPLGLRLAVFVGCSILFAIYLRTGRRFVRERMAEETTRFAMIWSLLGLDLPLVGRRAVLVGWGWILGGALLLVFGVLFCFFPQLLD